MRFRIYKKGQGVWTRSVAAAGLAIFLIWGCSSLYDYPTRAGYIGGRDEAVTSEMLEQIRSKGIVEIEVRNGAGRKTLPVDAKELLAKGAGWKLTDRLEYKTWWALVAFTIPFIEVEITRGHLAVLAIFLVGAWLTYMLLNREKNANFLIETEGELKKVSWSTMKEVKGSSIVVMVFVVIMGSLLWLFDFLYKYVVQKLNGI